MPGSSRPSRSQSPTTGMSPGAPKRNCSTAARTSRTIVTSTCLPTKRRLLARRRSGAAARRRRGRRRGRRGRRRPSPRPRAHRPPGRTGRWRTACRWPAASAIPGPEDADVRAPVLVDATDHGHVRGIPAEGRLALPLRRVDGRVGDEPLARLVAAGGGDAVAVPVAEQRDAAGRAASTSSCPPAGRCRRTRPSSRRLDTDPAAGTDRAMTRPLPVSGASGRRGSRGTRSTVGVPAGAPALGADASVPSGQGRQRHDRSDAHRASPHGEHSGHSRFGGMTTGTLVTRPSVRASAYASMQLARGRPEPQHGERAAAGRGSAARST